MTVGFTPAAGAGTVTHGVTGSAGTQGDSPLGLFDALLTVIAANAEGSQLIPAPTAENQSALGALFAALPATTAPSAVPTGAGEEEAPADLAALLGGLIEALNAATPATGNAEPLPEALEGKLNAAIEALTKALGIALPESSGDADVPAAATGGVPAPALDPLAAIVAAAAPAPVATDATPAAPAAAAGGVDAGAPPAIMVASTAAVTPEAVEPQRNLPPVAVKLAEKLADIAKAFEAPSPALAEKLTALADALKSGAIGEEALAKLGLPTDADTPDAEIDAAIARLLAPLPEAKPAGSPAPFTTATLALPEVALAPRPQQATRIEPRSPTEAPRPAPVDAEPAVDDTAQVRTTDRAPSQDQNPARPASAAATQAGVDTTAPQAQSTSSLVTGTTVATVSADTRAMHAAYKASVQQINIPQVAFEIVRQVQAGNSRFQIRLDPPELGRIDVKLDMDSTGNVQARLTVERAETLDLMQRDHRALERALAQAGLDSAKPEERRPGRERRPRRAPCHYKMLFNEFSLRQNPFAHDERSFSGGQQNNQFAALFGGAVEADDQAPVVPIPLAYRGGASAGGINIFV